MQNTSKNRAPVPKYVSTKQLTFSEFESPFERKFGQAKTAYGLDRIKARLSNTSQSRVASIILVLNLVHLAEVALLWILLKQLKLIFRQINDFFYSWKVNSNYRKIIVG
jgi:hypothetical protein